MPTHSVDIFPKRDTLTPEFLRKELEMLNKDQLSIREMILANINRHQERSQVLLEKFDAMLSAESAFIENELRQQLEKDGSQVVIGNHNWKVSKMAHELTRTRSVSEEQIQETFRYWINKQSWGFLIQKSYVASSTGFLIIRWR